MTNVSRSSAGLSQLLRNAQRQRQLIIAMRILLLLGVVLLLISLFSGPYEGCRIITGSAGLLCLLAVQLLPLWQQRLLRHSNTIYYQRLHSSLTETI